LDREKIITRGEGLSVLERMEREIQELKQQFATADSAQSIVHNAEELLDIDLQMVKLRKVFNV